MQNQPQQRPGAQQSSTYPAPQESMQPQHQSPQTPNSMQPQHQAPAQPPMQPQAPMRSYSTSQKYANPFGIASVVQVILGVVYCASVGLFLPFVDSVFSGKFFRTDHLILFRADVFLLLGVGFFVFGLILGIVALFFIRLKKTAAILGIVLNTLAMPLGIILMVISLNLSYQ